MSRTEVRYAVGGDGHGTSYYATRSEALEAARRDPANPARVWELTIVTTERLIWDVTA